METNPNLGLSVYDHHYQACRCVYCNEVVILNQVTLEILFQEEIARQYQENVNNDFFFLTYADEQKIKERIAEYYGGSELAYDQCIHARCLALLQKEENKGILNQIALANRQNMVLPDPALYDMYPINSTNVKECLNICAYCHFVITTLSPGFAYCLKTDRELRCLYLHYTCYESLTAMRDTHKQREKLVRRNFIHFLTMGQPIARYNYSVKEMAEHNDAWYEFLSRYELTFDERDVFNAWLNFISDQKSKWTEAQLIGEWQKSLRYDDLSVLVDEQLRGQTLDQLNIVEKVIQEQLDTLPIPTRCIPAPNPLLSTPTVVCFGPPSPTNRQPPLLYLNLVQTLIQVLTPPVKYSVFSILPTK